MALDFCINILELVEYSTNDMRYVGKAGCGQGYVIDHLRHTLTDLDIKCAASALHTILALLIEATLMQLALCSQSVDLISA